MHFEDYPELTKIRKNDLLGKAFTKGRYSVKLEEISAYLDDKDIATKATRLPTERFRKILSVYAGAWRHKFKNCNKENLRIKDDKTYTSEVMRSATHSWLLDLLWEAVDLNIPAPQDTNAINRTNIAARDLHTAKLKRGIKEDEPVEEITFDSFIKLKRNTLLPYLKEHWKIDSHFQNSSVSEDRETRIYPEAVKTAKEIYSEMHTNKLTKEEKINFLYKKKIQITQDLKSKYGQVTECSKAWRKAIHHMADLEQKHQECLEEN
jgi:hypothetical protein